IRGRDSRVHRMLPSLGEQLHGVVPAGIRPGPGPKEHQPGGDADEPDQDVLPGARAHRESTSTVERSRYHRRDLDARARPTAKPGDRKALRPAPTLSPNVRWSQWAHRTSVS